MVAGASLTATVIVPAEFREIVTDAGLIVRGRVTDVRSFVAANNRIDSVATVAVDSLLKGQAETFVSVRVPGGEIGRTRYVLMGAPVFRVGEQAVFFLKRGPDSVWRPIGLTMGVYRLQGDASTGRPVVRPPVLPERTPATRGDVRRRMMPVSEFESLVRLVMAAPPAQAVPRGRR
jgi:hypothetical protein